jgi:hypothetical protein
MPPQMKRIANNAPAARPAEREDERPVQPSLTKWRSKPKKAELNVSAFGMIRLRTSVTHANREQATARVLYRVCSVTLSLRFLLDRLEVNSPGTPRRM